jgi:alpha-mannosidase
VLRLSLIRGPVRPDPESDQGVHKFTYSLLPHAGNWRRAQVARRGYELNIPALAVEISLSNKNSEGHIPPRQSFLQVESESLIVETLKQAEAGDDLVLRTFDSHGCHANIALNFSETIDHVAETDLMEENPVTMERSGGHDLLVSYTPYEIKTHRIDFKRQS